MNAMVMPWVEICALGDIPARGCRVVQTERGQIAVFRTVEDEVFALDNRCPHKGGPLSEGIVHGRWVTCPLHNWRVAVDEGCVVKPSGQEGACVRTFPVRVENGIVQVKVSPT